MKKDFDLDSIDMEKLVMDKFFFNEFIYTPLPQALVEIRKRRKDKMLEKRVDQFLRGDIPKPFVNGVKAVLDRQLFTPNYEFKRFLEITSALDLEPLFLEYHDDKFTSNNPLKHALGKMKFRKTLKKDIIEKIESRNVIDFNTNDGAKIKDVKTIWHQSLVDFHHELLESVFPNLTKHIFDTSEWPHSGLGNAKEYYTRNMALFVRNGILFENFSLQGSELNFVKKFCLPAFFDVWKSIGSKPLVVALLPIEKQENVYWQSYPMQMLSCIDKKKMV